MAKNVWRSHCSPFINGGTNGTVKLDIRRGCSRPNTIYVDSQRKRHEDREERECVGRIARRELTANGHVLIAPVGSNTLRGTAIILKSLGLLRDYFGEVEGSTQNPTEYRPSWC